jgi:hypothetical protein
VQGKLYLYVRIPRYLALNQKLRNDFKYSVRKNVKCIELWDFSKHCIKLEFTGNVPCIPAFTWEILCTVKRLQHAFHYSHSSGIGMRGSIPSILQVSSYFLFKFSAGRLLLCTLCCVVHKF